MVKFQFESSLENGLDVKKAGEFVKEAIKCGDKITVLNGSKKGDAKLIFNVMSLNIKQGDMLEFIVEGDNEARSAECLEEYVRENL